MCGLMSACMHALCMCVLMPVCTCLSVYFQVSLCVCLIIIIRVNNTNKTGCDVYSNENISVSKQGVMMLLLLFSYDLNTR